LLVSAVFAGASAFVDVRPAIAGTLIRRRALLRVAVLITMALWFVWTVVRLPPLHGSGSEAATDTLIAVIAIIGTVVYAVSAARYWMIFRHRWSLLPAATIACFLLLSEAMIGVAVNGERKWHASWWGMARPDRERVPRHRTRGSPRMARGALPAVVPVDDAGTPPGHQRPLRRPRRFHDLRRTLRAGRDRGGPQRLLEPRRALITREFGGDVEKFIGDGVVASFNSRGDQPDHALRATGQRWRCNAGSRS
jgi:hypothetical protein